DVDTRWSSTLLMIERAILLQEAITKFTLQPDFEILKNYQLNDTEWRALGIFKDILLVPHAFQQELSAQKTPTLCNVIPAFRSMEIIWKEHLRDNPETSDIVQAGLNKLSCYAERLDLVPAYVLSLS
ncbi:hypothetical protein BDQ17DRAFT_1214062, partial [Cyathus striatus]